MRSITLPEEIRYYDNQVSGLFIQSAKLYLLSESRLQDGRKPVVYVLNLREIDRQLAGELPRLSYHKLLIDDLEAIRQKMQREGQEYEGLEAIYIDGMDVYLSVETTTRSAYAYLLKGELQENAIVVDTAHMTAVRKPTLPDGRPVYNASFEAITLLHNCIQLFYEYNYFPTPYTYSYGPNLAARSKDSLPLARLPFRLTDLTPTGRQTFTGINYFYKGDGEDTVYRVPPQDDNYRLIRQDTGFVNYCRLVEIHYQDRQLTWKPLFELPVEYRSYNWEGISVYRKGYFLVNDKYTPRRPYETVLIYLQPK